MTATPRPSIPRIEITSAYAASLSRIGSWVVVSALVYRTAGGAEFAMLALVRGTIGLLNYVSVGLAPAFIHRAARARPEPYVTPASNESPLALLYSNALSIAFVTCSLALAAALFYAIAFERFYHVPVELRDTMWRVVLAIGIGSVLRLASDVPGGVLQVRNRITLDNAILAGGDVTWMALCALISFPSLVTGGTAARGTALDIVSMLYAATGAVVLLVRFYAAGKETGVYRPRPRRNEWGVQWSLLTYGGMIVAAQLADYLYSPTDYILIDRLLRHPEQFIADYAPAVQIDSGLLLLVSGLAAVLLPKAALAHAAGAARTVRRYYVRGTVASFVLLLAASLFIWLVSPWLFTLWFGNPMSGTRSILPLVLANTVIGGSSAVGRSILLAVGKARPFAISVLVAGVTNVACSYVFVRYFHWGLNGIILGTVVAVVGRCVIWMPWYVNRALNVVTSSASLP